MGIILGPLLGLLSLGVARGRRQGEVADKPLSFSLPGFRESLRRRFFMAGGLTGLAGAWLVVSQGLLFPSYHWADVDPR